MKVPVIIAIAVSLLVAPAAQAQAPITFFSFSVREASERPWPGALTNRVTIQAARAAFYAWGQRRPHPQRARTRNQCAFVKTRVRLTGKCLRRASLVPRVERMTFVCNKSARGACRMTFPQVVQVPANPPTP